VEDSKDTFIRADLIVDRLAPRLESANTQISFDKTFALEDSGQGQHRLFAGLHARAEKGEYPLPQPIESAFSNSRIAVFETDVEASKSRILP